jgi:exodeoxyribonuclease VII large subunit
MRRELQVSVARFAASAHRLQLAHPGVRLQQQMQRLDDTSQRLAGAVRASLQRDRLRLLEVRGRLLRRSPEHRVREFVARQQGARGRLDQAVKALLARATHRLALAQRSLDTVSPLATLTRGFAIVTRADGTLVTDATALRVDDEIEARLARGSVAARVTGRKS